jgi:hypothetical protein
MVEFKDCCARSQMSLDESRICLGMGYREVDVTVVFSILNAWCFCEISLTVQWSQ